MKKIKMKQIEEGIEETEMGKLVIGRNFKQRIGHKKMKLVVSNPKESVKQLFLERLQKMTLFPSTSP